ncbi:MAG: hypothetical protein PHD47_00810 [Acholeplasmataceae bacterium]|nr:hypothetical protein [Acholeplasmataceae bacterium]
MHDLIKTVLLTNSSQMGFNWIYNRAFLLGYSKDHEMLMQKPNSKHYHENKPSYNSYPNSKLGDNTLQGQILKWLYDDWKEHESYTTTNYKNLLLKHFMPGGLYSGYVESFGNKLVLNALNEKFNLGEVLMDDDQLVGFIPLIVAIALNKPSNEALNLTYVLTNNPHYKNYFEAITLLLDKGKEKLVEAISLMPREHQEKIKNAVNTNNAKDFIKDAHDLACSINVAMPIIFYLYNKHPKLIDALNENVILGGASGDRALLLGLLYYPSDLPKEWYSYLK